MSAGLYNLYVEQNATFSQDFIYQTSAGTPISLLGGTMTAQIRQSPSDSTIVSTFTVTIYDQTVPANVGKFNVALTSTQTAAIPVAQSSNFQSIPTNFCWDCYVNLSGVDIRLLQGTVVVSPSVTR
jgi:hypothetical protein